MQFDYFVSFHKKFIVSDLQNENSQTNESTLFWGLLTTLF